MGGGGGRESRRHSTVCLLAPGLVAWGRQPVRGGGGGLVPASSWVRPHKLPLCCTGPCSEVPPGRVPGAGREECFWIRLLPRFSCWLSCVPGWVFSMCTNRKATLTVTHFPMCSDTGISLDLLPCSLRNCSPFLHPSCCGGYINMGWGYTLWGAAPEKLRKAESPSE